MAVSALDPMIHLRYHCSDDTNGPRDSGRIRRDRNFSGCDGPGFRRSDSLFPVRANAAALLFRHKPGDGHFLFHWRRIFVRSDRARTISGGDTGTHDRRRNRGRSFANCLLANCTALVRNRAADSIPASHLDWLQAAVANGYLTTTLSTAWLSNSSVTRTAMTCSPAARSMTKS